MPNINLTGVEATSNKSTNVNTDQASNTKYPSVKAVYDWAVGLFVGKNAPITGATKTKVTYDANGLVTSGADATTADIADSSNKRYVTDANLTVIGNTSGTNTGDQDLSGFIDGSMTTNYLPKASDSNTITNSQVFDNGNIVTIQGLIVGKGNGNVSSNTSLGVSVFGVGTTGAENIGIGNSILSALTSGIGNTGIGHLCLEDITTGGYNIGIGRLAGSSVQIGSDNVFIGNSAGAVTSTTATANVAIGSSSLYAVQGSYNIAIGTLNTGYELSGGNYNVFLGAQNCGRGITTGSNNVVIGSISGLSATLENTIILGTGAGNERVRIDSAGNMGIGTTTPAEKLEVNGNIRVTNETASRVAIIDASKNVKSADTATYPSLTELSYAKGVTSALQTQLNNKVNLSQSVIPIIQDITTSSALTGTTAITLIKSALIPANTILAGDEVEIKARAFRNTITGNATNFLYYNTSASLSGATLIATQVQAAAYYQMYRGLFIRSATTDSEVLGSAINAATDYTSQTAISTLSINWTADVYIIQAFQNNAIADSTTSRGLLIKRSRL